MQPLDRISGTTSESVAPLSSAAERILAQFEQAWQSGQTPKIETFLADVDQVDYLPLLEEFIRLELEFKRNQNLPLEVKDYLWRFPDLKKNASVWNRIASEANRLTAPTVVHQEQPQLPGLRSDFQGFQLLSQLGQGAFGRVYLARQGDLAQRLVVLKVAPAIECEAQSLARLQHTNIVPIFSVHESQGSQAICMPFLGVTTLADLVDAQVDRSVSHSPSARDWISTVAAKKIETIVSRETPSGMNSENAKPSRGSIEAILKSHLSFGFDAFSKHNDWQYSLVWIWSQIAEGLAHAHAHGITHGDIKPANILLSDDGHPLLLDFNLASHRNQVGQPIAGGTLPYMSAEQLLAFQRGMPSDQQGDLYSLAVVMYQLFTGRLPFQPRPGDWETTIEPMLQDRKSSVTPPDELLPGLHPDIASILCRALQVAPDQRYQDAESLILDLQRFLTFRPLVFAANRSWRVRMKNWAKRHPRLSSASTVAIASLLLLSISTWGVVKSWQRIENLELTAMASTWTTRLREAQWPLTVIDPPRSMLLDKTEKLRELIEQTPIDLVTLETKKLRELRPLARQLFNARLTLASSLLQQLSPILPSSLSTPGSAPADAATLAEIESLHRECQRLINDSTSSVGLLLQQSKWHRLRGDTEQANQKLKLAQSLPPESEIDLVRTAYELLTSHDREGALRLLKQAIQQNALNFEAWLLLGNTHALVANWADADACFSVCIGLEADSEIAYYNRGRARLDRGDWDGANADFTAAIAINPNEPAYYSNRALIFIAQENWADALLDLTAAIDRKIPETRVYYLRAQVLQALGREAESAADHQLFLELPAVDAESLVTRSVLHWQTGQQDKALADIEQAISQDPQSVEAWQNQAAYLSELPDRADAAIKAMSRVVELQPENPIAYASRGVLHARLGNATEAHRDAAATLQLDSSADSLYRVAGIHAQLSKRADPDPKDIDRAWELLFEAMRQKPQLVASYLSRDPDIEPLKTDARWQEVLEILNKLENLSAPRTSETKGS